MAPSPQPQARSSRGIIVALVILLAAAAFALWFLRETLDKGSPTLPSIPGLTSSDSGNATADAASNRVRSPLSPILGPGGESAQPLTSPQGTPQSPPNISTQAPAAPTVAQATPQPQPTEAPKAQTSPSQVLLPFSPQEGPGPAATSGAQGEDSFIRMTFVTDLAQFLVENYWPKGTHPSARSGGISTVSLKWANMRYGADLKGFPRQGDPMQARKAILNYVLHASTVEKLYSAYAESFVTALSAAASEHTVGGKGRERELTPAEKQEMFSIYATQARGLAAALKTYAGDSAMRGRVEALLQAEQAVYTANMVYLDTMADHERAQDERKKDAINTTKTALDAAAKEYQSRIQARGRAQDALEKAMGASSAAKVLGDDTLVYTAAWAYRRGEAKTPALRALAATLDSMAARLAAEAKNG